MTRADYKRIQEAHLALWRRLALALDAAGENGDRLIQEYNEAIRAKEDAHSQLSTEDRLAIRAEWRARVDEILGRAPSTVASPATSDERAQLAVS